MQLTGFRAGERMFMATLLVVGHLKMSRTSPDKAYFEKCPFNLTAFKVHMKWICSKYLNLRIVAVNEIMIPGRLNK